MGNEHGKLPSSIDLLQECKTHYEFIQELNFSPIVFHRNTVKIAIIRYEQYWLPFLAKHPNEKLVAPLDIELVWVSHMLDPYAYEADCVTIAGKVFPHHLPTLAQRKSDHDTRKLWNAMYQDRIPFKMDVDTVQAKPTPYQSVISCDLLQAVNDYRLFARQVSLPHYEDDKFLEIGLHTYLLDAQLGDQRKISYPYHKGFVWKTHMLNPYAYNKDIKGVKEEFIKSVHKRKNSTSHASVVRQGSWHQAHESVPGAMFRGDVCPLADSISYRDFLLMGNKVYSLSVTALRLENLEQTKGKAYHLNVNAKAFRTNDEVNIMKYDVTGGGKGNIFFKIFDDMSVQNIVQFDTTAHDLFHFQLLEGTVDHSPVNRGYSTYENSYDTDFSFPGNQDYAEGDEFKVSFTLPLTEGSRFDTKEISGWLKFRCDKINVGNITLSFAADKNHISLAQHYGDVLAYPMMMAPYTSKLDEAPCVYLNMLMMDEEQKTTLKCRILQSNLGEFSAVEIFDSKNSLIASSYTIGKESLPSEKQVKYPEKCCILRDREETVFVIRSTNHEWGMLKVFKQEDEITPAALRFLNLKNVTLAWENLYDAFDNVRSIYFKANKGGLIVDIDSARITLPPSYREFPELISLGATIITLFCVKQFQKLS